MKAVTSIKEMEEKIELMENCTLFVTKELDDELNRGLAALSKGFSASSEEVELFFKVYELMDKLLEKGIRYEVEG